MLNENSKLVEVRAVVMNTETYKSIDSFGQQNGFREALILGKVKAGVIICLNEGSDKWLAATTAGALVRSVVLDIVAATKVPFKPGDFVVYTMDGKTKILCMTASGSFCKHYLRIATEEDFRQHPLQVQCANGNAIDLWYTGEMI